MKKEVILSYYIRGDKKSLSKESIESFFRILDTQGISPQRIGLDEPLSILYESSKQFSELIYENIDNLVFLRGARHMKVL